jgi:hypothetical protein
MRPRTLWILLALVAALAAFVWFVERDLPGSDERAERAKKVLDLEIEEIARVAWARGDEGVELSRSDDGENPSWSLVAPLSARADDVAVERLLDLLAGLEKQGTLESGEPGELGLDPPRAVLTVETEEGERRLAIGGAIPASESMIVEAGDGPPFHVVAGDLWAELERPAGEWRSRDVFPGESDEIARFSLGAAEGRLVLARRGEDFWLEAPIVDRADEGTVSRFLTALTGLEIEEFVDDVPALEEYGLAPSPAAELEVVLADGSPWKLELGATSGGEAEDRVYARAEDAVVLIADRLGEDLARPADEWRSLDWTTLKVFEIDGVQIADAEGPVSLERESGQWERDGEQIDFNVVSDLLYAITGSKAEALDVAEATVGEPVLSVTLNPGEGEEVLEIFEARADRFPARTSGRETILWLGGDRVRDIRSRLAEARAAAAAEASEGAADASVE